MSQTVPDQAAVSAPDPTITHDTLDVAKNTQAAIDTLYQLLVLKQRQFELLKELRRTLMLALRAGVDPNEIARCGYDPSTDMRHKKWPAWWRSEMSTETNYVILKDGRRVEVPIDWETRLRETKAEGERREKERTEKLDY